LCLFSLEKTIFVYKIGKEAALDNPQISRYLMTSEIEVFGFQRQTGHCGAMVDQVLTEVRETGEPG
jgi:hypothetical protein